MLWRNMRYLNEDWRVEVRISLVIMDTGKALSRGCHTTPLKDKNIRLIHIIIVINLILLHGISSNFPEEFHFKLGTLNERLGANTPRYRRVVYFLVY